MKRKSTETKYSYCWPRAISRTPRRIFTFVLLTKMMRLLYDPCRCLQFWKPVALWSASTRAFNFAVVYQRCFGVPCKTDPLLDSSCFRPSDWRHIAVDIGRAYHSYDGFVVCTGTDTMAYAASALSFMLENLGKTVRHAG